MIRRQQIRTTVLKVMDRKHKDNDKTNDDNNENDNNSSNYQ